MVSILPYLNKNGSHDYMKVLVGLPYLWDVCRKARSGCFGPFVSYEYFPRTDRSRKGRKGTRFKEKGRRRGKNKRTTEGERKASREEKTQQN